MPKLIRRQITRFLFLLVLLAMGVPTWGQDSSSVQGQLEDELQALAADSDTGTSHNVTRIKTALAEKRSLLVLESKHIEQLTLRDKLSRERLALAEQWTTVLSDTYQNQQDKSRQQTLEELQKQLATEKTTVAGHSRSAQG